MSVNHGSMATHGPQVLPSFAQAFSTHSLSNIPGNNSLPPIQSRRPPMDHRGVHRSPSPRSRSRPDSEENSDSRTAGRKRTHNDITSATRDEEPSGSEYVNLPTSFLLPIILFISTHHSRGSPNLVRVKQEQDQDMLDPTPPPPDKPEGQRLAHDFGGAPPPSSLLPSPLKKRRMTVSGAPHALNTDVRAPADQTNSTPISPVVMGFTIQRDNPSAVEQVRSMITVKQKQKALIEQRRGSVAGVMSPNMATSNPSPAPVEERISSTSKLPSVPVRTTRRSPNMGVASRRPLNSSAQSHGNPRAPSPNSSSISQQQLQIPSQASQHSLPPPPISFAKRRAAQMGGKKKPADIVISPRELHTPEQFQPSIQSAPPIPHAGQGQFGRFTMALPRLPSIMGVNENVRKIAGNVPPTPTRLALQRNAGAPTPPSITVSGAPIRSPPASVPIASTLVPPTPASLHHPGYSGDKSAFLAPFEMFYDALNDSKQLKTWLGEQLQKSNALMQTLTQQQEKLNDVVETMVERRMATVHTEISGLRQRVGELEDALRDATSGRRHSIDFTGGALSATKQSSLNGASSAPSMPEGYTFPPGPSDSMRHHSRRPSSPGWGQDRDGRSQFTIESEPDSSVPYDARRTSVSASRLDPPRIHNQEASHFRTPNTMQSPPQPYHENPIHPPNKPPRGERPSLSRQASHTSQHGERSDSPKLKRAGSRRNSVVMSPPEGDDS